MTGEVKAHCRGKEQSEILAKRKQEKKISQLNRVCHLKAIEDNISINGSTGDLLLSSSPTKGRSPVLHKAQFRPWQNGDNDGVQM